MDTFGLLAAWVGVVSFLSAVLVAMVASLLLPTCQHWWAQSSSTRAKHRLDLLEARLERRDQPLTTSDLSDLVHLYGNTTITLIAAIGLLILSIQMLDLGPQLLSSMLPFQVDSKILTRTTGVLTLVLDYLFILRLVYLGRQIWAKAELTTFGRSDKRVRQVLQLREQLRKVTPSAG